jgi:hypothetical protein
MSYCLLMAARVLTEDDFARLFPSWEHWTGEDGLAYARQCDDSAAIMLCGKNWADLRTQIRNWALTLLI